MLAALAALVAACPQAGSPASPPKADQAIFLLDPLELPATERATAEEASTTQFIAEHELKDLEPIDLDAVNGRYVYALPVPAARRESDRPVSCELLAADGSVIPLERGNETAFRARIVGSVQSVECEFHSAFRDCPRRTFKKRGGGEERGAFVGHNGDFAIKIERYGAKGKISWHGALLHPPEPELRPRIEIRDGEQVVGQLDFRNAAALEPAIEIPPANGLQELVFRVVGLRALEDSTGILFDCIDFQEGSDQRDRLIVRTPALTPGIRVRYMSTAATRALRLSSPKGGDAGTQLVNVLSGEAAILTSLAQPLSVFLDDQPVPVPAAPTRELLLRFDARACKQLRVTAAGKAVAPTGDVWFVQPDAIAGSGASIGRGNVGVKAIDGGRPLPVGCGDDTRRALLLTVGGSVDIDAPCRSGDVLEYSLAVKHLTIEPLPLDPVTVDLALVDADGKERALDSIALNAVDQWRDARIELGEAAGARRLRVRTRSTTATPVSTRVVRIAFAEPTLVRRAPPAPRPPNVLVYLIDTLRADHCSTYGYARPTTPRMDELGREGIVFEKAYAQAPWTRPSVASIFCGVLPSYHGAGKKTGLTDDVETVAEILRGTGRTTAAFIANSKVHAGGLFFEQGFNTFVATDRPTIFMRADEVNAAVLPWLQRNQARPFFLYVHTIDPHSPYDPPAATRNLFEREYKGFITQKTINDELIARAPLNAEDLQHAIDLYDEEIVFNDTHLGVLLDELKRLGLYDDTLIIVLSDHGEEFQDHGSFGHGARLWQELLHVPLVVKFPKAAGIPPGRVSLPVRQIDVLPTLLHSIGRTDDGAGFQGVDLAPYARGLLDEPLWVIAEEEPGLRTLIEGRFKVIEDSDAPTPRLWLFDLENDPREQDNLAPKHPDRAKALLSRFDAILAEFDRRGFPRRSGRRFDPMPHDLAALNKLGYTDR